MNKQKNSTQTVCDHVSYLLAVIVANTDIRISFFGQNDTTNTTELNNRSFGIVCRLSFLMSRHKYGKSTETEQQGQV